jgi:hypothetical protein
MSLEGIQNVNFLGELFYLAFSLSPILPLSDSSWPNLTA